MGKSQRRARANTWQSGQVHPRGRGAVTEAAWGAHGSRDKASEAGRGGKQPLGSVVAGTSLVP